MSENVKPLLSIVVPTKNRYYYLMFFVRYFNSFNSKKIELIIQDNSDPGSNHDFKKFLESINDKRISYSYTSEDLSVVENCDRAVAQSIGEYVTLIGDDDIFSKHLIDYVEICKTKSIEALLPVKGTYTWPDVQPRFYKKNLSGIFRINNFTGKSKRLCVNSIQKKVLRLGGTDILDLPRIYHGVIKNSVLKQVYIDSGSYFPGPSPDMANSIALCKYVKHYIKLDIPLIISGHSVSSGGGQGAQGQHYGDISKLKHLPKDTSINWTPKIPFYWSGITIYAESAIQALKRMNMEQYIKMLNFDYLYASCLVYDPRYKEQVKKVMRKYNYKILSCRGFRTLLFFILIWIKRIMFHLRHNLILWLPSFIKQKNTQFKMNNILDVAILNDELISKNIRVADMLK